MINELQAKTLQPRENRASAEHAVNPVHLHALDDDMREIEGQLQQIENAVQVLRDTPDQIEQFLSELQRAGSEQTEVNEFEDIEFEEVECGPVTDLTLDEVGHCRSRSGSLMLFTGDSHARTGK